MVAELHERPHFVYRAFAADGALLYIGCTSDVDRRFAAHRKHPSSQRWIHDMDRLTVEEHPDQWSAMRAEWDAIRDEHPRFNIHANPKPCKIEGCDEPHNAKGWCRTHYSRNYHYGDPLAEPTGKNARIRNRGAA